MPRYRHTQSGLVIIILILAGLMVVAFGAALRPIEMTTSAAGVDVWGAGYRAHINATDVVAGHRQLQ